jgi:hypothetical protein
MHSCIATSIFGVIRFRKHALLLLGAKENVMPIRSRDEVWSYAEGVNKLIRARKHLENRGAEKACIRLLENVIRKAEREFFKPTNPNNS